MRILHVITDLDIGGAEMVMKRLIEAGDEVERANTMVISLTTMGSLGAQLQQLGFQVEALNLRGIVNLPHVLWQLRQRIKTYSPDIVQTWLYHADLLGGLAARMAGIKHVVWNIRATEILPGHTISRMTYGVMRLCAWLSRNIPEQIICVAHAARLRHISYGYVAEKMLVIPNGFDTQVFSYSITQRHAARAAWGIKETACVIGSIGRFNGYKDHRNFIAAAAQIAAKNDNVILLMIGKNIDTANIELLQWIEDTGYAKRFILLGEQDDMPGSLSAMDVFCLHSISEGFPNVLGEAMSMSLPCVTTDTGDAALLLGDAGIVVPTQNPKALAAALQTFIQASLESRAQYGKNARQRIENNYSLDSILSQYNAVYANMIKP